MSQSLQRQWRVPRRRPRATAALLSPAQAAGGGGGAAPTGLRPAGRPGLEGLLEQAEQGQPATHACTSCGRSRGPRALQPAQRSGTNSLQSAQRSEGMVAAPSRPSLARPC